GRGRAGARLRAPGIGVQRDGLRAQGGGRLQAGDSRRSRPPARPDQDLAQDHERLPSRSRASAGRAPAQGGQRAVRGRPGRRRCADPLHHHEPRPRARPRPERCDEPPHRFVRGHGDGEPALGGRAAERRAGASGHVADRGRSNRRAEQLLGFPGGARQLRVGGHRGARHEPARLPGALGDGDPAAELAAPRARFPLYGGRARGHAGAQGGMADYREADAGRRYSGWGYGGTATAQWRKFSAEGAVVRLNLDPANGSSAPAGFKATQLAAWIGYALSPYASLEVGLARRSPSDDFEAQSLGAIRLGARSAYEIGPGAVISLRANYLAA